MANELIAIVVFLAASIQCTIISEEINTVDNAQADFAIRLLQEASKENESVVLSPLSITVALSMAYSGSNGRTKQQLHRVLANGVTSKKFNKYIGQELRNFADYNGQNYTLEIANRLYLQQQLYVKYWFLSIIRQRYAGGLQRVDFRQKNAVVQDVNSWVANATHNKIKDLLTSDSIDEDALMMILNAIYFKGTWQKEFDKKKTQNKTFHITDSKNRLVSMMSIKENFLYFEDDKVQFLGLPYSGKEIQMFLILPKTRFGLSKILETLTGQKFLEFLKRCEYAEVEVELPQFKVEKKLNLVETLKRLGVTDLFNENANLSYISNLALYVSNVVHKAFVEVNEKGTEAAASTGLEFSFRMGGDSDEPQKFIADHPFLFTIVKNLKTILFVGQISQ